MRRAQNGLPLFQRGYREARAHIVGKTRALLEHYAGRGWPGIEPLMDHIERQFERFWATAYQAGRDARDRELKDALGD